MGAKRRLCEVMTGAYRCGGDRHGEECPHPVWVTLFPLSTLFFFFPLSLALFPLSHPSTHLPTRGCCKCSGARQRGEPWRPCCDIRVASPLPVLGLSGAARCGDPLAMTEQNKSPVLSGPVITVLSQFGTRFGSPRRTRAHSPLVRA